MLPSRLPRIGFGLLAVCVLAVVAVAARRQSAQPSPITAELRRIFEQDQNEPYPANVPDDSVARVAFFTAEWNKHFKPRQDRVTELVRQGRLRSGEDYSLAGMIFNHRIKPEHNPLTHALLTAAALKNYPDAPPPTPSAPRHSLPS